MFRLFEVWLVSIEVLKIEDFDDKKRASMGEYWLKKYKLCFVVITSKNGSKARGVLQELTPHNYLVVSFDDKIWEIDPLEVADFYAKPDKFGTANNGGVKNLQ